MEPTIMVVTINPAISPKMNTTFFIGCRFYAAKMIERKDFFLILKTDFEEFRLKYEIIKV